MMTERTSRLDVNNGSFPTSDTILHNGKRFIIVRNAQDLGEFHLVYVVPYGGEGSGFWFTRVGDALGVVYHNPKPGTTAEDVMGAVHVHWDGTHHNFSHATPEQHHDYAEMVANHTYQAFQPDINEALEKLAGATNKRTRDTAADKSKALRTLAEAAKVRAHSDVMGHDLGYFHRNPTDDHARDIMVRSINGVLTMWEGGDSKAQAMRTLVLVDAARIVKDLTRAFTVQTRAQKAAAEEAAKKAKQAAESGSSGNESSDDTASGEDGE